jgi:hypothetical protein
MMFQNAFAFWMFQMSRNHGNVGDAQNRGEVRFVLEFGEVVFVYVNTDSDTDAEMAFQVGHSLSVKASDFIL